MIMMKKISKMLCGPISVMEFLFVCFKDLTQTFIDTLLFSIFSFFNIYLFYLEDNYVTIL